MRLNNVDGNWSSARTIFSSRLDHEKLCMSSALWRTRILERLVPCGDGHGFHTSGRLCTTVCGLPVGDVGNGGSTEGRRYWISKSPELHRQDLENPTPAQVVMAEPLGKDFHFSCYNYWDYCLFLLSNYSFPTSPSDCTARQPGTGGRAVLRWQFQSMAGHNHQPPDSRFRPRTEGDCPGQASHKQPFRPRNSEIYPAFPPTPGSRR